MAWSIQSCRHGKRWMILFAIFCLIQFPGQAFAGLYGSSSSVIELNVQNFKQVFDNHVWMVEFYAPWCGHCKQLAPQWEAAASKLKGLVRFAAVNCDIEENKQLAGVYGIQGFPTIKVFGADHDPNPYQAGAPFKEPKDYQGPRSAKEIASFAIRQLPTKHIQVLKDAASADAFLADTSLPKCVVMSEKTQPSNLLKALSLDLRGRMVVAQAHRPAFDRFGVSRNDLPVVLAMGAGEGVEPERYEGDTKHAPLLAFLEKYALAKKADGDSVPPSPPPTPPPPPPRQPEAPELVDQAAFERKCERGICVIGMLDPRTEEEGAHDKYVDTLLQASGSNKHLYFMWVDGPRYFGFCDHFGATNFPTLVVFSPEKNLYTPYVGSFTKEAIDRFLSAVTRGKKRSFPIDAPPALTQHPDFIE